MDGFQFTGQGEFALLAVENTYTDFPDDKAYNHQLPDGIWILARIPVAIDAYCKEWIGTIRLERLENSNLSRSKIGLHGISPDGEPAGYSLPSPLKRAERAVLRRLDYISPRIHSRAKRRGCEIWIY